AALRNRTVADFGEAEAAILLPQMTHRNAGFGRTRLDDIERRRPRSVVGHDDLEIALVLPKERTQTGAERIGAVVGRNDERDQLIHGAASRAMLSDSGSRRPRHSRP